MKFAHLCEKHPDEFHVYGGICKKCVPSAVVRSITADSLSELEEPFVNEVLMVISNSEVILINIRLPQRARVNVLIFLVLMIGWLVVVLIMII